MRQTKGCNCITQLEQQLKSYLGVDVMLACSFSMLGECYPYMYATYHKAKKDGSEQSRESLQTVIPSHCPFCGRKYEAKVGGGGV